jgi:hypothetical protein
MEALRLYTVGSSWFSAEESKKGSLAPGQLADLSVLSADYFSIPAEQIKHLESVLTIVGGRVVFGGGEFERLGPPPLPVSPGWSPVKTYGGYAPQAVVQKQMRQQQCGHHQRQNQGDNKQPADDKPGPRLALKIFNFALVGVASIYHTPDFTCDTQPRQNWRQESH